MAQERRPWDTSVLDTNGLLARVEQELADGNPSARATAWSAHHELFEQRDAEGLERLLDLASRLESRGNLTKTIRHDLEWLSRRSRGRPDAAMDSIGVLLGALAGGFVAIALTYLFLHNEPEADALVWLAVGLAFLFFGIPLGAVLAFLFGRRFQSKR
jgi:hypothetical protein